MISFAEFQAKFQKALLEHDASVLDEIIDSPHEKKARLLSVYQSAYILRLIEMLRNDYPLLVSYVGVDVFNRMARGYAAANVSTNADARWFGHKFPDFLASDPVWAKNPELSELAEIERALADVFDAADAPHLTKDDLKVLEPEDWPGVEFSPHPATRRVNLVTNARALWKALKDDEDVPPAEPLAETERIIAYRPELTSMLRPMAYEEAMMFDEMSKEVPFGGLCEMVATYGGEDEAAFRAAGYLNAWISAGMLAGPEN